MRKILGTSILSSKGTVTIPKKVRELLRLSRGEIIVFEMTEKGEVIIRRGGKDE